MFFFKARQERVVLRGFGTATASRYVARPFIGLVSTMGGSCLAYISSEDESSVRRISLLHPYPPGDGDLRQWTTAFLSRLSLTSKAIVINLRLKGIFL